MRDVLRAATMQIMQSYESYTICGETEAKSTANRIKSHHPLLGSAAVSSPERMMETLTELLETSRVKHSGTDRHRFSHIREKSKCTDEWDMKLREMIEYHTM
jgi:hypothetical protein